MLAYKAAVNGKTRVVISLEIPDDAKTNLERPGVLNKETATYRADKVKVLKIEDADGNTYETAKSLIQIPPLTYTVGETVQSPNGFDADPDKTGAGIYFVLHRQIAEQYALPSVPNGLLQWWRESGQKWYEATFLNGELHGVSHYWHETGHLAYTRGYANGRLDGSNTYWDKNGNMLAKGFFLNGRQDGLDEEWYEDTPMQKRSEAFYKNGKLDGAIREWSRDGRLVREAFVKNGVFIRDERY